MILGFLLFVSYVNSGMAVYFRSLLLIFASKDEKFVDLIKTMFVSMLFGIIISLIIYAFGLAPDLINEYNYEGIGLGFGLGNIIGELLCICIMMGCYISVSEGKKLNLIILAIISALIFIITTSKTATIISFLTPYVIMACKKIYHLKRKNCFPNILVYALNPFLIGFAYFSAMLYPYSDFIQKIDLLLTNRIFLNYYAFEKYSPKIFGQIASLHDTGVYNVVRDIGNITVTVDNTYALSLIELGIIGTIIFSIGYIIVIKKAINYGNYAIIAIAVLLCLYGFTEVKMIEIYDNFVYLSIFGGFIRKNGLIS
jgi:uncharacterized membrane protein